MLEEASAIFDYLPIEAGSEKLYIQHLWEAFTAITGKGEPAKSFAIMPFHLLFMLAAQYKVYKLSDSHKTKYLNKISNKIVYRETNIKVLQDNIFSSSSQSSVKNLSLIKEKNLFDFFEIINLDKKVIEDAKELIDNRSKYAHANCNMEDEIDEKIDSYLKVLNSIQLKFKNINNSSQNWAKELQEECGSEDGAINEFFEQRFLQSQFSPRDFGDIIQNLLIASSAEQLKWISSKGLDDFYCNNLETINGLKYIAKNDTISRKRLIATEILSKNNGEF